jgi:hypothetical protein
MKKQIFLHYEEAQKVVRAAGIKSRNQWYQWIKTGSKPGNIPSLPQRTYAKEGWTNWGDFLGTNFIATHKRKYRAFKDALKFVRQLGIASKDMWVKWSKTVMRPKDIPSDPRRAYVSNWISWGHWLGTGSLGNKNRTFLPFDEARKFAHSLCLKNQLEWRAWTKTKSRPHDMPANPPRTYKESWKGWADFLGTDRLSRFRPFEDARDYVKSLKIQGRREWHKIKKQLNISDIPSNPAKIYSDKWQGWSDFLGNTITIRSFELARIFVRSLGLKSQKEWYAWANSNQRPQDIPKYPHLCYANQGWLGMADFFGTNKFQGKRSVLSFSEAKQFARTLKFKSQTDWRKWAKTDAKPINVPASPSVYYAKEGWSGWGDFLGTGIIAPQERSFRTFEEARAYARSLQLKSETEWNRWAKTNARPSDIPSSPRKNYKNKGWVGFGDFLGTGFVANQNRNYRSFAQARELARSLQLQTGGEWVAWTKTSAKPADIPANPCGVYKTEWQGWADFLGVVSKWSIQNIRLFVSSILPHLESISPAGLYVILQQTGILDIGKSSRGQSFVQALKTGRFPKEELEKFANKEPSLVDRFLEDSKLLLETYNDEVTDALSTSENDLSEPNLALLEGLPSIETKDILSTLDSKLFSTLDVEAIDFFIKEAVARIWQHAFTDESTTIGQLTPCNEGGTYSSEVRRMFLGDYNSAKSLHIPAGYSFSHEPNLMQRYTAHLVKSRRRLGNWSGTGAGKTLSAVLASRVIGAKLTVVCCPNNVITTWTNSINSIYPDSFILTKSVSLRGRTPTNPHQYLILNYEFFQQPRAESKLKRLLNDHRVDFVIIDEIHHSKQRELENVTRRKRVIAAFLSEAAAKNENLHILGMSATPIINNLFEGKTLIELITGVHHDELQTSPTVENCISHYQKFISHGIRWLPQYHYKMNLCIEDVDCSAFIPEIKYHRSFGSMINIEATLTRAKIPFILQHLRSKTIVYTHYIQGILSILQEAIEKAGWKVSIFCGENKDGLEKFVKGDADILIASSCIATGVDGLQDVCNRLIINSLPWTHAEFEQLKGRIYRQGQKSEQIDIFIPLTFADIKGERWSWCESRWKRIQYKKSIADAAIDGVIPEGHLRTPAQAYRDVMLWLDRLDRGEVYEVERRKISIPLSDEISSENRRKFGDLTQINYRISHTPSGEMHERFLKDPAEWEHYHAIYREDRKNWPIVPYQEAIKWCKARPCLVIGDFGCGEALLASEVENEVHSFDHIAINERVIACDMAHVPLDDSCLDASVFSLSLMGSNFIDYLKEAHRCLKLDGHLWIAEPTSRIKDIKVFQDLLFRMGFDVSRIDQKWEFTFIKAIKSEREQNFKALEEAICQEILR